MNDRWPETKIGRPPPAHGASAASPTLRKGPKGVETALAGSRELRQYDRFRDDHQDDPAAPTDRGWRGWTNRWGHL